MKRLVRRLLLWLLAIVGCLTLAASTARAADPSSSAVRRFALLVGANDGGTDRELLRYAGSDAAMFGKALVELGGLDSSDRVVLDDPDVAGLERGFADLSAKIRAAQKAGERIQFVFYYSGHSDETGLLLGGVHLDYKRLRGLIDKLPADVRIAILDSCSSGAFTRFKGGRKREPFLAGAAAEVEGHAYLTSSSADEAAQESDRIGGSFFTHFLVTGLRGAADFDGDRRVTLNEAYRFAFDETLARTETTSGGPQHAAYDIQLAGTGDLVMTDLRKTSATLEIAGEVAGRIYVRDRRGNLAAELFKPKHAGTVTLALEPGNYAITIDDGRNLHRAEVEVRSNKTELLEGAGLEGIALEGTRLRGDGPPVDRPLPNRGDYTRVPFNIGVAPGAELNAAFARSLDAASARSLDAASAWSLDAASARRNLLLNNFSVSLAATGVDALEGMQLAIGGVWTKDYMRGVQGSIGASISRGPTIGLQTALGVALSRGDLRGVQSAAVSLGYEQVLGVQIGYGFAYAKHLRGLQLAALGLAGETKGVQAGLISITHGKVDGLQVGLINYADEADASIGLIPVTKKGGVWFDLWTSDVQLLHAALRFRANRTYSFLSAGVHPIGDDTSRSFSGAFGFGGPLLWRRHVSLELDNAVSVVNAGYAITRVPYLLDTLRLSLAWRPVRHFAIWGAVTGNLLFDFRVQDDGFRPGYGWAFELGDRTAQGFGARIWPGFALGFEF